MITFHKLAFVLCTMSLCALVGCKDQNPPVNPDDPKNTPIHGNVAAPAWAAPAEYDMSSSMTVIAKVDLSVYYAAQLDTANYQLMDNDLLAAFAGNECLGVVKPVNGKFYLYICAPSVGNQQTASVPVVIRYYSHSLRNVFVSVDNFLFMNDATKGSADQPYVPQLKVSD